MTLCFISLEGETLYLDDVDQWKLLSDLRLPLEHCQVSISFLNDVREKLSLENNTKYRFFVKSLR